MGESIHRLLTSKRSLIALVTVLADLAVIFGLDVPAETQEMLVTILTALGGALIAGRSVSDHGEAQSRPASAAIQIRTENGKIKPSDVDTENAADGILSDD